MSSLLTNTSAMVALQTLRDINMSLDKTNNQVSTGLRVNSAADNAAYWSIATTIRSDNGALGAVQDALGLGKSSVDTANTGLDTVRDSLQKIKELLVTAASPEADRTKLQTEIDSLLAGMKSTADSSVISGNNWLSVAAAGETRNVVASFSRSGDTVSLDTINVALDGIALYTETGNTGLLDKTISVDGYTTSTSLAASVGLTDEFVLLHGDSGRRPHRDHRRRNGHRRPRHRHHRQRPRPRPGVPAGILQCRRHRHRGHG